MSQVEKLLPNRLSRIDADGLLKIIQYWQADDYLRVFVVELFTGQEIHLSYDRIRPKWYSTHIKWWDSAADDMLIEEYVTKHLPAFLDVHRITLERMNHGNSGADNQKG